MENLTFSQAYGYEDLPQQLKLEELPPEARTHIWNVFYEFMVNSTRKYEYSYVYMVNEWERILDAKHLFFDNRPMDDWDDSFEHHRNNVRKFIETSRFNRVFDLIQFVFRHVECPREFVYRMQDAFRYSRLAYEIDTGPPSPT